MDCARCQGACCEEIHLPLEQAFMPGDEAQMDHNIWLAHHGELTKNGLRLGVRCERLMADGRCEIYAERPQICQDFEPGGKWCLDVVRRRRTAEQYEEIRGDDDPGRIHG